MSVNVGLAKLDADLFINGAWTVGAQGRMDNVDPGTAATVGRVSLASPDQVVAAIDAATEAFRLWSTKSASARGAVISQAAQLLCERMEEAVATLVIEAGKTEADARGEIQRSIETLSWNASAIGQLTATVYPGVVAGSQRTSIPVPLGPVAAITAWNFPAVLLTRKLGAALGAGCSVVVKAAESTPATARLIVEVFDAAGLPPGVINLLFGEPQMIARQLTDTPKIKALTFTGSTAVGKSLAAQCAPHLQRAVLELGGHAPVMVMPDADIDQVVALTAAAKFGSAGQSCVAPSRYFVHESRYEELLEKLNSKAASYVVGHGVEPDVTMGPVANSGRVDAFLRIVADAIAHGATVTTGGNRLDRPGFFVAPTIIAGLPLHSTAQVFCEEPFGPIATVSAFTDVDEAIEAANATPYSFGAYVFTDSARWQAEMISRLNASNIGINQLAPSLPDVPLGGIGNSGYGYEGGLQGMLSFCQLRLVSRTSS